MTKRASQHPTSSPCSPVLVLFLGMLLLTTFVIRFAEPVKDGDLWWQMAYGRYFIENHTLIPDHTLFSWTPTDGTYIYCAWIAEVLLYALYEGGGLLLLFVFRYLCLSVFVVLLLIHAKEHKVAAHPLTWLICLVAVLMSQTGAFIKPEIFSYTLMTVTVWTWWRIRLSGTKHYCYFLPCLILIWVNSHGGFIFGMVFLGLIGFGEALNALVSPQNSVEPSIRKHLFFSLILCGMAIMITPYGYHYPAQLVRDILEGSAATYRTFYAYRTIFHPGAQLFHYVDYFLFAGAILFVLFRHKLQVRQVDWTLVLTNLAFAVLYTRFLRATFYWAVIFAFSATYLLSCRPKWLWPEQAKRVVIVQLTITLLCLGLGGRACFDAVCKPFPNRWLGFGNSYQNPVEEAEFIRTHLAGRRLGNDYGGGGYLLWALWPQTKVFIDPRHFPFKDWYMEYLRFWSGQNVTEFMEKYPCDVWCVSLRARELIVRILLSPDWKLSFYGPSAAVFTRRDLKLPDGSEGVAKGVADMKNVEQAINVLFLAKMVGDSQTAELVLEGMDSRFRCANQKRRVQRIRSYGQERFDD